MMRTCWTVVGSAGWKGAARLNCGNAGTAGRWPRARSQAGRLELDNALRVYARPTPCIVVESHEIRPGQHRRLFHLLST